MTNVVFGCAGNIVLTVTLKVMFLMVVGRLSPVLSCTTTPGI